MKDSLIVRFLISIAFAPLAVGLTCRTCIGPAGCRYVKAQTCSDAAASVTSRRLDSFHPNVTLVNSSSFSCLAMRYLNTKNSSVQYHLFGCVQPDLNVCSLPLKPDRSDWSVTRCFVCSANNCNRNSAGSLSESVYIIGATISLLPMLLLLLSPAP